MSRFGFCGNKNKKSGIVFPRADFVYLCPPDEDARWHCHENRFSARFPHSPSRQPPRLFARFSLQSPLYKGFSTNFIKP
ncbi:MAG: hypothetical protein J6M53_08765 [Bacteroidaceae bacterium]|nr:hypothetical protein [Bacteroidaceae bacterium]